MQPAGLRRHPIRLQREVRTSDGQGGETVGWVDGPVTRAEITPFSMREAVAAGQLATAAMHRIRILYRSDVTADQRVRYGSRTFDIQSVIDVDERHRLLEIICQERKP